MIVSILTLITCLVAQAAASYPNTGQIAKSRIAHAHFRRNTTGGDVPSTQGLSFTIDGQVDYFGGTNSYWISYLTENADVDLVLDHLHESGLRILRIWGFSDVNNKPTDGKVYFQLLHNGNATINTGPDGLQRLDYVVTAAEKRNIKLIINFVNNWSDYGGIEAYTTAFGGTSKSWFTSPTIQNIYRQYIKAVVSRYSQSSAIFAWELANEPRCNGCNTSVIHDWAASTSAYIKSLDPKHMVAIGDEGFGLDVGSDGSYPFTYAEGLDFATNLAIDTIDFGTFHLYPSTWGVPNSFGNNWITAHAKACAAAQKPCLMEEYGVKTDKCTIEGQWRQNALDTKGIGADLFWQYGDKLSTGNSPNDDFTLYRGTDDYKCVLTDRVADT